MRLLKWLLLVSSIVLLVGCSTGNNDEVTTMAGNDASGQIGDAEANQALEPVDEAKEPWSDYVCVDTEGVDVYADCPDHTYTNVDDLGPFQKGVFLNEIEYPEKYTELIKILKANLTAWADKDEQAYLDTFISERAADLVMIQSPVDYQFVGTPYIEDKSDSVGWINILFEYRTSDQEDDIRLNSATFENGKDGIAMID
jgi:hypothetical protein